VKNMSLADWIQTGVLMATTFAVALAGWQTHLQNRLLKAQLLRDRFEMYWKTYDAVSAEQVAELKPAIMSGEDQHGKGSGRLRVAAGVR
jgi:hypothetical protein